MIHYRIVQVDKARSVRIICNKCGQSFDVNETHPDFTEICNTYGYGSHKDGDKYTSHICEPCMDAFYSTFVVPPQVVGNVVWGEDPGRPMVFVNGDGTVMENAPRSISEEE